MLYAILMLFSCVGDDCHITTKRVEMDACFVLAEMSSGKGYCVPDMMKKG